MRTDNSGMSGLMQKGVPCCLGHNTVKPSNQSGLTMVTIIPIEKYHNWLWSWKTSLLLSGIMLASMMVRGQQPFEMDTIWWTGPADQRINMVFLSDGYTADQLGRFIDDVHLVANDFFRQSPFREYKSYFNLVAIKVPSAESGAKKDPSDPLDNYFGSSFNYAGIERLLVAGKAYLAQEILFNQFPFYHQAVLIVNDSKYGGSGGWLATTSVHESAPEIALHEIGHSFAGLADEYWAGEQFAGERANMTRESDPDQVKWKNWLDYQEVGIFSHGENPVWFRPHQNCKMRVLNPDFCPVCREALVKQIHQLTYPVIHFEPEMEGITLSDDSIIFRVELLQPDPYSLSTRWTLDLSPVATGNELTLYQHEVGEQIRSIDLTIVDTTHFVRDPLHEQEYTYFLNWLIRSETTANRQSPFQTMVSIYPNPAVQELHILLPNHSDHGLVTMELLDLNGRSLLRTLLRDRIQSIPLASYAPGSYLLRLYDGSGMMASRILKL